jgi:hypothetical protein
VACIACPTLYAYLKKSDPGVPTQLLEYDERFGLYGGDFTGNWAMYTDKIQLLHPFFFLLGILSSEQPIKC